LAIGLVAGVSSVDKPLSQTAEISEDDDPLVSERCAIRGGVFVSQASLAPPAARRRQN